VRSNLKSTTDLTVAVDPIAVVLAVTRALNNAAEAS
jgi:hypothetical protein